MSAVVISTGSGVSLNAPTWGGDALTEVTSVKQTTGIGADTGILQAFYLKAPAAGVSTCAFATSEGNWLGAFFGMAYCTGIDQTTPIDTQNSAPTTSSATSENFSITTLTSGDIIIDQALVALGGLTLNAGGSQTRYTSGNQSVWSWGTSWLGPVSPAGATTMAWSYTGTASPWIWNSLALKPAAASAAIAPAPVVRSQAAQRAASW